LGASRVFGFFNPLPRDHGNPLLVSSLAEYNLAAQNLSRHRSRQIAVKAEKTGLQFLPYPPMLEQRMRRLVLGGEDQGDIEI
jgi:hypothetical protein